MISIALILAASVAQAAPQPVVIQIQNPSFERLPSATITHDPCFDSIRAVPPSWVLTYRDPIWGGIEVRKPLVGNSCLTPMPPDGSWILLVASSTISQDTGIKPSSLESSASGADGDFMMTFLVANEFTVYPGYYEAAIIFGTIDPVTHIVSGHELCSIDGWAKWQFKEVSLPCSFPGYLLGNWPDGSGKADPNAHIIISLSHIKGWPVLFDNVSLTFTPQ